MCYLPSAFGYSTLFNNCLIFSGADVTHPGAGDKSNPSIAAVVASKDSYPTLYNAEVRVQKHRQEMIDDLKEMVKILLKKFRASTKVIPGKIIFYRDGVSEGQFRDVLIRELSAIQGACLELQEGYTPAITFIVVQKRHHARLFAVNPKDRIGTNKNIPAGGLVLCFITKRHLLESQRDNLKFKTKLLNTLIVCTVNINYLEQYRMNKKKSDGFTKHIK